MSRDLAIRALLAIGRGADVETRDYQALRTVMRQYLTGARPGLSPDDLSDAVDESISRLLARPEVLAGLPPTDILGYTLRSARNAQVDRWRSTRHEVLGEPVDAAPSGEVVEDAAILGLLDKSATLTAIRDLMTQLRASNDITALRVIVTWLDIASGTSTSPTAREVADRLNLSHTTVVRALHRARAELTAQRGGPESS